MDTTSAAYCRDLEHYLCKKNDGHLIRITGPAFERVVSWAEQGIPLSVAREGIDRSFERYYRRGPRRRPLRIEFCEADVLDMFDTWRRAVGVAVEPSSPARAKASLASHLERVMARITALRASSERAQVLDPHLEQVVRELDGLSGAAKARGQARVHVIEQLVVLDDGLMQAAVAALSESERSAASDRAREQLAAFRDRMTSEAHARAIDAALAREVRDLFGLPVVAFA